ncbi:helix-turn-helix transcriptional regulator [Desulfosporosinus hippei]|uniref:Predicted DNA-binding transcriptional regulator YafY, contains an HTH and WYL domains n=1 Tax=Desulfosporosinus hippei DSM 8344 TaxID=1121419 RepID=A0A1G8IAK2_9FIRM|nr:YafY family protein [Desulfosporosinus hippei]SDI15857.1 Predicted DNA-binding transcriptional regulator YafY, contains an HTH and WYL domains [Desulfosporosinus hippei DSM 8344]
MQINRLFEILYILLDKKAATAKALAERFEVSTRTIYRDIETLSSAGIPVYMSKGKGGGISLLPDFVLNKAVITDEEREDILSSLKAVNAVNLSKTDTALKKLSSLFGDSNPDWIEVDFSSWANPQNETVTFNTIKSAILGKRIVSFAYASAKGQQTAREVEPLKLCFKSGAWYLYGYCKSRCDFRFFKLRRIRELCLSEQNFQRKSPSQILSNENVFKEAYIKLKLKLSAEVAYRVYDEFESYDQQEDGSFIAEINYPKGKWIVYYITTFGRHCEVLEPQDVRNDVQAELQNTLKHYL